MGYIRNECVVVSGWDRTRVEKAHRSAVAIFAREQMEDLVGDIVPHTMNGGAAFLIAPDGSKEGWEHSDSDLAGSLREEFMAVLKGKPDWYLEWALILLGGDDGEYRVLKSPNAEAA